MGHGAARQNKQIFLLGYGSCSCTDCEQSCTPPDFSPFMKTKFGVSENGMDVWTLRVQGGWQGQGRSLDDVAHKLDDYANSKFEYRNCTYILYELFTQVCVRLNLKTESWK